MMVSVTTPSTIVFICHFRVTLWLGESQRSYVWSLLYRVSGPIIVTWQSHDLFL